MSLPAGIVARARGTGVAIYTNRPRRQPPSPKGLRDVRQRPDAGPVLWSLGGAHAVVAAASPPGNPVLVSLIDLSSRTLRGVRGRL